MDFTARFFIGMCVVGILIATVIVGVGVYGIKPDFFKYKMNDTMTEIKKGNNTFVCVGELDDKQTMAKVGEKFSLIQGRKLDNLDNFDVYAINGKSNSTHIAVQFKDGKTYLFAREDIVENPPVIDEEFYNKAHTNKNALLEKIGEMSVYNEFDEKTQRLILLISTGVVIFSII